MRTIEPDSLISFLPDSAIVEPLKVEQPSDLDTVVYYEAKMIDNDIAARKSYFTGDAVVKYDKIVLKAGKITMDWDSNLIFAEPIADSIWTKTDSTGTDSTLKITWIGEPVLEEGGTTMTGKLMEYNYKTEKGRVVKGRSELEGGQFVGNQVKRINSNTFNLSHSTYTTCDLDSNPHFHFEARRMKMIPKDKVIAKPIVAKIGNIPVFMLPFAVFPHKSGRSSGILIPAYGQSAVEGRYLRHLGYYWAPNDYFDAKGMVDFFEKSGFLFHTGANYAVRYKMNGRINASITRKDYRGGDKERRWDLTFNHSQEISPTSRISASGNFVSDKNFYKSYSSNLDTRLNRELRSNMTYSKSWPKQKLSMSMNLSHSHDLQEDLQTYTLPQFSLRRGQAQIFNPKKKGGGRRDTHWYHSLYFSYNSNLTNSARQRYETIYQDSSFVDENGKVVYKTFASDTVKTWDETRKIAHNINLSMTSPKKFFGWLSLNQSMAIKEDWFNETYDYYYDEASGRIEQDEVAGFAARHTFSYTASANTKAYGVFPANIGDINSFRHVMTPSVSLSWAPDFTDEAWGYYQYVDTPTGEVKKDRFGSGTPGIGGGNIGFSVRNLFQMRKGEGEEAKKIDLFNVDLNTAYNMKATTQKLSDLRTSWTANPIRTMSLSASTMHSFYEYQSSGTSDTYVWENGGLPRLTNFRFNFRLRLQGKGETTRRKDRNLPQSFEEQQMMETDPDEMNILDEELLKQNDRFESDRTLNSLTIPWRMSIAFNFDLNRRNPEKPDKRYYMDISGAEVSLTQHWRIGYSAHYDLAEMQISHHRFTIYRDLHCWEANIEWVPTGPGRRVYVRVGIKAPMLRDVKVEKYGGRRSVLGY